jgi:hypothetical protein
VIASVVVGSRLAVRLLHDDGRTTVLCDVFPDPAYSGADERGQRHWMAVLTPGSPALQTGKWKLQVD